MGSWRCGLCIGAGRDWEDWREGGGKSQLFVLNGKNVLVNVYQNVNLYDYSLHVDLKEYYWY